MSTSRHIIGFLLALGVQCSLLATAEDILRDRLRGAVIGSALGDALARGTSLLDTKDEIESVYGVGGLTGMERFTEQDWVKGANAAYTGNSVISSMMLSLLIGARKNTSTRENTAALLAKNLIELFGLKNKKIDPLFDVRYHTMHNRYAAERLAVLQEHQKKEEWWLEDDIPAGGYDDQIAQESDSSAIMRAWPVGLAFSEDIQSVKIFTDYQTRITHRHPTVRAASVALAVGIAYALQGASVDMVVNQMVKSAAQYNHAERVYKPHAKKIEVRRKYNPQAIINNEMLTSDMIRYAADMAQIEMEPDKILGTTDKRQENKRSFRGFLLGYEADEAVAAAVYIFVRHGNDLKSALIEGVNACGRSSLIASLAGALVGARVGVTQLSDKGFEYELSKLENRRGLEKVSDELCTVLKTAVLQQAHTTPEETPTSKEHPTSKECHSPKLFKWPLVVGVVGVAGWLAYKYVLPYVSSQPAMP
jgi:ADP-ribosylglycohydrolase